MSARVKCLPDIFFIIFGNDNNDHYVNVDFIRDIGYLSSSIEKILANLYDNSPSRNGFQDSGQIFQRKGPEFSQSRAYVSLRSLIVG